MRPKKNALTAVAVIAMIGVIAFLAVRRQASTDSVVAPEAKWPEDVEAPAGYTHARGEHIGNKIEATLGSRVELQRMLGANDRDAFARVAAQAFDAYWQGDMEAYRTLLRRQGLHLSPEFIKDSGDLFRTRTMSVRDTPVDLSNIGVEAVVTDGKQMVADLKQPVGWGTASVTVGEPRGPEDLVDPLKAGSDVAVVTIPAQLRNYKGKPFQGEFRMFLARRPSDDAWLIIRLEIKYPSSSEAVVVPPV